MNDEDQENEAQKPFMILTAPTRLTVPGFGFLVALNLDWCFTSPERNASRYRVRRKNSEPFHSTKDNKSCALKRLAGSFYK